MVTPQPLASVTELADWVGEPIPEGSPDASRAAAVLRLASALVRTFVGRAWADPTNPADPVPAGVVEVVLQVAGRGFTNPEGWGNERLDDWGAGQRPVEEWGLYLTASEKAILAEYRPSKPRGIGALSTFRESVPDPWAGLVPTPDGQPIPWW